MESAIPLFVALPLAGGFAAAIVAKLKRAQWIADILGFAVTGGLLAMAGRVLVAGPMVVWIGKWDAASVDTPNLTGINMVVDGVSSLVLLIVNLVAFLVIVYSISYMRRYTALPYYYSLFLVMVAGMNGAVLAGDLFNLYVFLEVAAIASYSLVAFGTGKAELEASFKYIILSAVGSAFILLGIGLVYNVTGSLNMAQVGRALGAAQLAGSGPIMLAAAFFFLGFGLKAAMVPFHAWLPDAHPSAPAPISAMLSGVLIKAVGVYALMRIFFNVLGMTPVYASIFILLGAISMVVGVLLAVGQWDFKRLLAYSSISQMGYVVLALGVGGYVLGRAATPDSDPAIVAGIGGLAIFGGLFHLFNHAIFKSLLFLGSGAVEYGTGTRQLTELGGLGQVMPVTSGTARMAALSISGVPPFSGFWSKLIIVVAVVAAGWSKAGAVGYEQVLFPMLGVVVAGVSFMTLMTYVKVQRYIMGGELPSRLIRVREAPALMCVAMLVLAAIALGFGVCCPLVKSFMFDPAGEVLRSGLTGYARMVLGAS
jgi:multicomponent Na+:H+ antiporter subunit D